jgi:predicted MFS family arabinose efflux permease
VLVRRALTQAGLFGAFTAYWTAVPYELISRHHLSQSGVGVFALVGAAGAVAAPIAGRLGDAGRGTAVRACALILGLVSMLVAGIGASNLFVLALGGVLLDFAVQTHQVVSQRDIYALRPDARARVNSVYMTSVFLGGAGSAAATGAVLAVWGWSGVSVMAAALITVGLVIWIAERRTVGLPVVGGVVAVAEPDHGVPLRRAKRNRGTRPSAGHEQARPSLSRKGRVDANRSERVVGPAE